MKRSFLTCAFVAVSVTACAPAAPDAGPSPAASPARSGITGVTMVDGGCPMVRDATPCPDRPVAAHLTVTAAGDDHPIARADSDEAGHFRITLPPGAYVLHPANLTGAPLPAAGAQPVTVQADRYTTVTVTFDSGVR